jgi:hypothetical protein
LRPASSGPSTELLTYLARMMVVLVCVALLGAGCGGDSGQTTILAPAGGEEPGTSAAAPESPELAGPEMTPADLGDLIGETYVEAIERVVASLANRPDGPAALTALQELKESYVQEFVELGRQREALEPTNRAAVDARISSALSGISPDLFDSYQSLHAHYLDLDLEIADLVISFNIISQYANFDLLTQQDPDEAARVLAE